MQPQGRVLRHQAMQVWGVKASGRNEERAIQRRTVDILKDHEAGRKVTEVAPHGVSEVTLYGWKSKYGSEVGNAQRLRGWKEENRRLKQLVADLSLNKEALKAIRKNGWSLPA